MSLKLLQLTQSCCPGRGGRRTRGQACWRDRAVKDVHSLDHPWSRTERCWEVAAAAVAWESARAGATHTLPLQRTQRYWLALRLAGWLAGTSRRRGTYSGLPHSFRCRHNFKLFSVEFPWIASISAVIPILHEYSNELHLLNLVDGFAAVETKGTLFHEAAGIGKGRNVPARCTERGNVILGTCDESLQRCKTWS